MCFGSVGVESFSEYLKLVVLKELYFYYKKKD